MKRPRSGLNLLFPLFFGVLLATPLSALGANCDALAVPVYLKEPILDVRAEAILQKHSLSALPAQLSHWGLKLEWDWGGEGTVDSVIRGAGYSVQRRVAKKILERVFHDSGLSGASEKVPITIQDSALIYRDFDYEKVRQTKYLEMMALKMGNPEVFEFSRSAVRARYGIPASHRVASIYTSFDGLGEIDSILEQLPEKPDVVFLSYSYLEPMDAIRLHLPGSKKYDFVALSRLVESHDIFEHPEFNRARKGPLFVYNDTRGRLPELYAASDFALVIGANNFFEPLIAHCPTLIYRGDPRVLNYSQKAWGELKDAALKSGGAVELTYPVTEESLNQAYTSIKKIKPEQILHPAFIPGTGGGETGFEFLLDDLEQVIRRKIMEIRAIKAGIEGILDR